MVGLGRLRVHLCYSIPLSLSDPQTPGGQAPKMDQPPEGLAAAMVLCRPPAECTALLHSEFTSCEVVAGAHNDVDKRKRVGARSAHATD